MINSLDDYESDTKKFPDYGLHLLKNLGDFFNQASVYNKQKMLSSIFKQKLIFEDQKYRTPILNKGTELISRIINVLQAYENKSERQSYDYLPLCTRSGNWTRTALRPSDFKSDVSTNSTIRALAEAKLRSYLRD